MSNLDRIRRAAFVILVPLVTYRLLLALLVPDEDSDVGQIGVLIAVAGGVLTFCVCLAVVFRSNRGVNEKAD